MSTVNAQSAVERFLTAFYVGDVSATRDAITADFTLVGPFATVHSADELFELAGGLLKIVRGHKVLRWVAEGNDVAALYEIVLEGPAGQGSLPTAGWFTASGGHVSRGQLIYDSAAFAAIVSPA
jgi:hypothetical protein